jgi:hypothetical protein
MNILRRFSYQLNNNIRLLSIRNQHNYSYTCSPSQVALSSKKIFDTLQENVVHFPEQIACISHHQGIRKTYKEVGHDVSCKLVDLDE